MPDLLLEVGCEEIPSPYLQAAVKALATSAPKVLRATGLLPDDGTVRTLGTPRRLVIIAEGLAAALPEETVWDAGPPIQVAFDADGAPTKAAMGFARGKGLTPADLQQRDGRIGVERHVPARPAAEVLAEPLTELIAGIHWPKTMRWGAEPDRFARPIHWICALVDGQVIAVRAGRRVGAALTRGHRFMAPDEVEVNGPEAWWAAMTAGSVIPDGAERAARIEAGAIELAKEAGGALVDDPHLVMDNAYLTEWPAPTLGHFDQDFLDVPREVLCNAMRSHQRYFAVEDAQGGLLNAFVAVNNTVVRDEAIVRAGHERVLRARLADARFFWDEDRKRALVERAEDLQGVVFLAKLDDATMRDKASRLQDLGRRLAEPFGGDPGQIDRAAELCKSDLTTLMVQEFPDLQGVMGRYYALHDGEDPRVADAIAEHYLPKGADGDLPAHAEGAVVALADRLDTLAAGFACGLKPTGSKDAYGLRRAALGVLGILRGRGIRLPVSQLVGWASLRVAEAPQEELVAFILDRLRHQLVAEGARGDVADAVLATGLDEALEVAERVHALSPLVGRDELKPLFAGLKRVRNIVRKEQPAAEAQVDPALFEEEAEGELHAAIGAAKIALQAERAAGRIPTDALVGMNAPIARFFDDVLVVHEDPALRTNRLAICRNCAELFGALADFSRIQV